MLLMTFLKHDTTYVVVVKCTCINASRHMAWSIVLVKVTVTNGIPKRYSRELSMTNDIPSMTPRTYALAKMWTRISCLVLILSAIMKLHDKCGLYRLLLGM